MLKKMVTEKKLLIFILCFAALLRCLSLGVFMYRNNIPVDGSVEESYPLRDDARIYYLTAKNLAEGKGYTYTTTEAPEELPEYFKPSDIPDTYYQNFYPPVYSAFLSILYRVFGAGVLAYAIPQIIIGVATCYLAFFIGRVVFSQGIGLSACFLLAIYHPLIWWTAFIRAETLFIFLLLLTIVFLIKAVQRNLNLQYLILTGITLAVSSLCRAVVLYLPIFLIAYLFIVYFRKRRNRLIFSVTIFLISFFVALLPWLYRNATVFNTFSITSSDAWATFYGCNVTSAELPFFDLYEIKYDDEKAKIASAEGLKEASIEFVKEHPLKYAKLCLKRFIAFWGPTTKKPSFIKKVADTIIYIIVFPAAFWGFYRSRWWSWKGGNVNPTAALLMTVILYYTILHTLVGVDDALIYRYPIIPLICIFSGYGYYQFFKTS